MRFLLGEHALDFVDRHRRRCAVDRGADEIADAGGLAEQVQDPVVEFDVHHQVSGELLARADDALAVTQFGNALDWNLDLIEVLVEALDLNSPLDRLFD